ncbi:MAG: tetratricopeptide repeat protein [Saprospiraceae bacterium]|nr:tetratricopeptide repeat protein [Saprospiraceae bacterium]
MKLIRLVLLCLTLGPLLISPLHSQSLSSIDSMSIKLDLARSLRRSDPDLALKKALEVKASAQQLGREKELALAEQILVGVYAEKANYLSAVQSGVAALEIFEKLGMDKERCISNIHMGIVNRYQRQLERSLSYYQEAAKIAEANGYDTLMASIWGNIGNVYYDLDQLDQALDYHQRSLEVDQRLQDDQGVGNSLHNIGLIYREKKLYEKALEYQKRSLELDLVLGNRTNVGISYVDFTGIYLEMKDFENALLSANKALEIAEEINSERIKSRVLGYLPMIYAATGDVEKAIAFNAEYRDLMDSLQAARLVEQIAEAETKYGTEKKERRLDAQEDSLSKQRQFIAGLILVFALIAIVTYLLFNRYKLKQSNRQLKLEHQQLQLKQETAQIRQMNEMKSRFFANISHEFRTPLNLILAPLRQHPITIPQKEVSMMRRNADRLLRLVNQLLDLSKVEVGMLQLHKRPVEISGSLQNLAQSFASLAQSKDIEYQINIPERDYIAELDPDKLEKIVYNFLSNAFKFTPAGGTVAIHLLIAQKNTLRLSVSDTGIGIAEDMREKIFDRFYQVDSSHTRAYEGTGIGLALTKELVELFEGEIEVDSQEGQGSVFTVSIPIQLLDAAVVPHSAITTALPAAVPPQVSTDQHPIRPTMKNAPTKEQAHLLLVEDNADLRTYLQAQLSTQFQVTVAEDGAVGLQQAMALIPDLIISDIMMPKLDGIGLTKALRSEDTTSHIPIVLLTARDDGETKIKGFETGAEQYLLKPFEQEELLARINGLLDQRRILQEKFGRAVVLEPKAVTLTNRDANLLENLVEIIEENMEAEAFSVDQLQKEIGMSRMQLHRKLKALTNQSASEFIRSIKLKRAAQLLQQGGLQITEVAYRSGFNHLSYFAKCFKEEFGLSPTDYAKHQA